MVFCLVWQRLRLMKRRLFILLTFFMTRNEWKCQLERWTNKKYEPRKKSLIISYRVLSGLLHWLLNVNKHHFSFTQPKIWFSSDRLEIWELLFWVLHSIRVASLISTYYTSFRDAIQILVISFVMKWIILLILQTEGNL